MTYLLDTNTLIWYFQGSPKLSDTVRNIIDEAVRCGMAMVESEQFVE